MYVHVKEKIVLLQFDVTGVFRKVKQCDLTLFYLRDVRLQ